MITTPEWILMFAMTGMGDLFGLFSGFVFILPGIGQLLVFLSAGVTAVIFAIVQFWLIMRGEKSPWYAGTSAVDTISGGTLPFQTPGLFMIFIKSKAAQIMGSFGSGEKEKDEEEAEKKGGENNKSEKNNEDEEK